VVVGAGKGGMVWLWVRDEQLAHILIHTHTAIQGIALRNRKKQKKRCFKELKYRGKGKAVGIIYKAEEKGKKKFYRTQKKYGGLLYIISEPYRHEQRE
jgi:hypothetical protein